MKEEPDVIVIGAGASGLMCAISAGNRGRRVRVLEKGPKVGLKILVSGGGRCNFTNLFADPREHYLSANPNFCISAMRRFQPDDFVQMVEDAGIAYHEKKPGQLFCDHSARDIVTMLLAHCAEAQVDIRLRQDVVNIVACDEGGFEVITTQGRHRAAQVVLASGGLSLPKIASDLAFQAAHRLGLEMVAPRPALVPLRWNSSDQALYGALSGMALPAEVRLADQHFQDDLLFTHRGLSGPAILQISSYWREGMSVAIDLLPGHDAASWLMEARAHTPRQRLAPLLKSILPNRLVETMFQDAKLASLSPAQLSALAARLNGWSFKPGGSEGYRTAEVTLGGIDTREVSSKTFELKKWPGLYVIGEALDVTGWLGGYNFQWAWASGWCCGQHV